MKNTKIRRFLAIILVQVMCISVLMGIPVMAADSDFIIENGILTQYVGSGGDVIIPDGVTEIGKHEFNNTFGGSISWIGPFSESFTVTGITMPDSVIKISDMGFADCWKLEQITLSSGLMEIPYMAFLRCRELRTVIIPESITTIGSYAFGDCSKLETVNIMNPDVQIAADAFSMCGNLKTVTVAGNEIDLNSVNGVNRNQNNNQNNNENQSHNNRPSTQTRQEKAEVEWNSAIQNREYNDRYLAMNNILRENGVAPYYYENTIVTSDMQDLSDELCAGLATNLDKVTAIHEWIINNIYYDYASLYDGTLHTWTAQEVLDANRTVCNGYTILFQALCWAQGIPCVYVTGATTNGHHAWNLVELDGEWQWVDSTWNTFNRYYGNNTWVDGDKRLDYFLCPTMFISTDHGAKGFRTINGINANLTNQSYAETQKLIQEEEEKIKETMKQEQDELQKAAKNIAAAASAWAQSEISTAILEELALSDLCENFTPNITREEFCRLMVRLVEKCSGQDIDAYLKAKGLSVNNKFTDTSSAEAAAANARALCMARAKRSLHRATASPGRKPQRCSPELQNCWAYRRIRPCSLPTAAPLQAGQRRASISFPAWWTVRAVIR